MFFCKSSTNKSVNDEQWQANMIEKLAFSALKEQRAARRWNIFFKLIFLAFFAAVLFLSLPQLLGNGSGESSPHTAIIRLEGLIASNSRANAESTIKALEAAFKNNKARGVILHINSPGGSAVQSDEIYQAIKRLKSKYEDKKLVAVISDMGASGGYFVASAADMIYANPSSLVGSIGVIFNGFGFVDAIDKLGVERRAYTAGSNKDMMDPFKPLSRSDQEFIQSLLDDVHVTFIKRVKEGRGDRLVVGHDKELFSGLAWTGSQAKALGLVDAFGGDSWVAEEVFEETNLVEYSTTENILERLGFSAFASWLDSWRVSSGVVPGVQLLYRAS